MSNQVFSFELDSPFEEEIQYMTIVSESEAGKEQRYQKWQRPRRTFRVKLDARTNAESKTLWNFYQDHKGSFDSFLFQNPNENPVSSERFGSGDGARAVFYLGNSVGVATGDLILTPSSAAIKRSIGGTGDFLTFAAYTIDENIGQLTTTVPLPTGDVLRADYNFRYRVRFKDDNLTRENFATNLYRHGIDLVEVI
jgi:uncharacterized protein (TIGR02217 family)